MKLVYPGWETPLVWRDGRFPLVVLEEPDYHFRIVQELCAAAGGADTAFVLSEGERLLDPARSLEVVLSPWSLVWDSRRIMTALYGRLKKECLRPELLGPAQEAAAAAARLAGRAGDCFSFPVVSEAGGDPMALLKALRLRPEPEEGPLAEQMLAYMTLCTDLLGTACFVFCGFRSCLAEDALRGLYRTAFLKHFHFFLLEPSCHRIIEAEERFTVDRDLCQIF